MAAAASPASITVDRNSTAAQIADWIASLGKAFESYRSAFSDNGIDGEAVFEGDVNDKWLNKQNITDEDHQKVIKRSIKKLITNGSLSYTPLVSTGSAGDAKAPPLSPLSGTPATATAASKNEFAISEVDKKSDEFYDLIDRVKAHINGQNEDYNAKRLLSGKPLITFLIEKAERITNTAKLRAFEEFESKLKSNGRSVDEVRVRYAFHGTNGNRLNGIARNGLLPIGHPQNPSQSTDEGWFGSPKHGVYVSRHIDYSVKYSNQLQPLEIGQTATVLMFKVIPGKCKHISKVMKGLLPENGYDSHDSPNHLEWYLFDSAAALPVYLITLKGWRIVAPIPTTE